MTTASPPPDPQPAGGGRWLWLLLAASLAVNLVVAGAVLGTWVGHRHDHHHRHGGRGPLGAVERFTETLPAERAEVISAKLRETRETLPGSRKIVREARQRAREALRAEPFDAGVFRAAMNELADLRSAARKTVSDAFIDAVTAMTADERKAFGQWLDARRRGRKGGKRGD